MGHKLKTNNWEIITSKSKESSTVQRNLLHENSYNLNKLFLYLIISLFWNKLPVITLL